MRIGMRLLLGYFLIVAIAAWFVLSIFVQEVKPGVRRATEGTLNDTATLLAALAREDLLRQTRSRAGWRRPFTSSTSSRSTPILAELKRYVMSTASI